MKELIESLERVPKCSLHALEAMYAYVRLKANGWNKAITCEDLEISIGTLRRILLGVPLAKESVKFKRKPKPKSPLENIE